MRNQSPKGEPFFLWFSTLLMLLTLLGFGGNAIVHPQSVSHAPWVILVHGIVMLLWYMLVIVQSGLIAIRSSRTHITIGKYTVVLAILIILSGVATAVRFPESVKESIFFFSFNLMSLVSFAILFYLAIDKRQSIAHHKRYIIFASLATLFPALFRITDVFGLPLIVSQLMWLFLIFIVLIYDYYQLRKIHHASIIGTILIFCIPIIGKLLDLSTFWKDWVLDTIVNR